MANVFISYVREDKDVVERLIADLAARGVSTWHDRKDLKPGQYWSDAIRSAIRDGDFFLACFSTAYAGRNKTYMNEELTLAVEELRQRSNTEPWFIPVKLNACDIPERPIGAGATLRSLQWVDLFDDWEGGIARILSTIRPNDGDVELSDLFLSRFIHDITAPLMGIRDTADRLTFQLNDDRDNQRLAQRIDSFATMAGMLLKNFRAATYLSRRNEPLYPSRLNLNRELREVCRALRETAHHREVELRIDQQTLDTPLMADASLVSQALHNVIENGVKYAHKGTVVRIDGRGSDSEWVKVNINNHGIPITQDDADKLFENGFRGSQATTRVITGNGLGLFVTKMILDLHGGTITLSSPPGSEDTRFTLSWPRTRPKDS